MFVPGTPASLAVWNAALEPQGLTIDGGVLEGTGLEHAPEAMWVPQDGEFGKAFSFGTVSDDVVAKLEAAPGALVLLWPVDLREGTEHIVTAVECLRDAGAIAVRFEQSKAGWEIEKWLELMTSVNWSKLHNAAVVLLGGADSVQSCGMHLFSLPDVVVPIETDTKAANELAQTFNVYQIAESPALRSGHTFRPDEETPRRVIERWPDTSYPSDHPCHNPYGVWRFGPAGGTARDVGNLDLTFIPSLAAILMASEEKKGAPLTEKEALAIRDAAAVMAMEPRDAQKLERSRGYADLNPDFVWEQWQLLRDA
jgi:hypothetical protein